MIDYHNTYKNFINAKRIIGLTKNEAHAKNLEGHHVNPKSLGGKRTDENIVWLSEFDHCIAHFLLSFALIQHNCQLIDYSPRKCAYHGDHNLVAYWNPLSKIKFEISNGNDVKIMTLLEAALYIGELNRVCIKKQRTKNTNVIRLIHKATNPSSPGIFRYFGMNWKVIF